MAMREPSAGRWWAIPAVRIRSSDPACILTCPLKSLEDVLLPDSARGQVSTSCHHAAVSHPGADVVQRYARALEQPRGEFTTQIVDVQVLHLGLRARRLPRVVAPFALLADLVPEYKGV